MVTRLQVKVKTFFTETQEMSENSEQNPSNPGLIGPEQTRRGLLVGLLGVLVSIEALLVTAGAMYFLSRIFGDSPENLSGAIVIFAITLIIGLGLIATAIATFKSKSWVTGAIVTWQILQIAVAISFIQGLPEWQLAGWVLAVLSLSVGFLVLKQLIETNKSNRITR
ncbi:hypothetical protein M2112_001721 [Aurantimicrobium minutum]|nr:hypothetical protein [Aurantimicrobium minutum]